MAVTLSPSKTEAVIKSVDANSNAYSNTIKNINPELTDSESITGWQTLNTNIRSLMSFTNNNYIDTEIVNTYSLEEVLADA